MLVTLPATRRSRRPAFRRIHPDSFTTWYKTLKVVCRCTIGKELFSAFLSCLALSHERTQVICTGSTLSRGDFCFRVFCGWRRRYNLSAAVLVTVTSLIVGIWKVFKSMVSSDSERDVQPRPRDHSWPSVSSASLRSKMAPRKGFYLFALGINLDLTSKKTRWILNESVWAKLQNTRPLISISLNKNSYYCYIPRSSKKTDTCK